MQKAFKNIWLRSTKFQGHSTVISTDSLHEESFQFEKKSNNTTKHYLQLYNTTGNFLCISVILRSRQLFHTTYKLYMTSLVCQVLYLLIMCIAYGKYANDGLEDRGLRTFGK